MSCLFSCLLTRILDIQMKRIEQTLLATSAAAVELDQVSNKGFLAFRGLSLIKRQIISREHERGNRVKMVATEVKSLKL